MYIYLIFRLRKKNGQIDRLEPVEYCVSEADVKKYTRLFDLQVPSDLKEKISHRSTSTVYNEKSSANTKFDTYVIS